MAVEGLWFEATEVNALQPLLPRVLKASAEMIPLEVGCFMLEAKGK